MPTRWLPPALDPLGRWSVALGLFLAATALQLGLPAAGGFPFLAFFPAILLCAWISGRVPALAVTAAATAIVWWFLVRPPASLDWPTPGQAGALFFFVCAGVLATELVSGLSRAALNAERKHVCAIKALQTELARAAELHHRTANTLQLVSSAVTLALRAGGNGSDIVKDATRRLDALGRYHRRLLAPELEGNPADVLAELARTQCAACAPKGIALELDLQPGLQIEPTRLATLAMILGEGISNALKHAFPPDRPGHILVRLHRIDSENLELEVRDDGVGLPDGAAPAGQQTAGLSIMQSLARQIDGSATLAPATRGTILRVVVPERSASGGT